MILEDCNNYREKLRECVELYILGKITKEQALKLLNSRYNFIMPAKKMILSDRVISEKNTSDFLDFLKTDNFDEANNEEDLIHYFSNRKHKMSKILKIKEYGNDNILKEAEKMGYTILSYIDEITNLYNFCKKELEEL